MEINDVILENFARQNGIESATPEEIAIIEKNKLYMETRPHLKRDLTVEQLTDIAHQVRNGGSLSALLGYAENE